MDFGGEHRSTSLGAAADGWRRFSDAAERQLHLSLIFSERQLGQMEAGTGIPGDSRGTTDLSRIFIRRVTTECRIWCAGAAEWLGIAILHR